MRISLILNLRKFCSRNMFQKSPNIIFCQIFRFFFFGTRKLMRLKYYTYCTVLFRISEFQNFIKANFISNLKKIIEKIMPKNNIPKFNSSVLVKMVYGIHLNTTLRKQGVPTGVAFHRVLFYL